MFDDTDLAVAQSTVNALWLTLGPGLEAFFAWAGDHSEDGLPLSLVRCDSCARPLYRRLRDGWGGPFVLTDAECAETGIHPDEGTIHPFSFIANGRSLYVVVCSRRCGADWFLAHGDGGGYRL